MKILVIFENIRPVNMSSALKIESSVGVDL